MAVGVVTFGGSRGGAGSLMDSISATRVCSCESEGGGEG